MVFLKITLEGSDKRVYAVSLQSLGFPRAFLCLADFRNENGKMV